jgi:site-specific recombinase XerD
MNYGNDTVRLLNDLRVIASIIEPNIDLTKLSFRLEEVLANYNINRKTQSDTENDLYENIKLYINARKIEGLSNLTLAGYLLDLNKFAEYVNKPTAHINTSDIRKYLASNLNWEASTIGKKLDIIRSFFQWLVQEEIVLRNPALKIKPPKTPRRLPLYLTVEELEIVRESCRTLRQRALVEVMYSTGARLNEIANIKKSDIDYQNMSITVVGKGNKQRIVYLTYKALYHLNKYLKSRNDDCEYLFVTCRKPYRKMNNRTIQDEIKNIQKQSGINKKIHAHLFRKTFAMLAMENGIEISDLQSLLGHSDPSTTLRAYAYVSEERKQRAFKKYHII